MIRKKKRSGLQIPSAIEETFLSYNERTDIVVDYHGQQYVIEMKIWLFPRYNEEGEQQLREYLDYFNLTTGYMLSFNFNKKKETGVNRVAIGEKVLFEATL